MVSSLLGKSSYQMCMWWKISCNIISSWQESMYRSEEWNQLQVEKLYSEIASQLCFLLLIEVCTHRYRGFHVEEDAAEDDWPRDWPCSSCPWNDFLLLAFCCSFRRWFLACFCCHGTYFLASFQVISCGVKWTSMGLWESLSSCAVRKDI